ncbi:hypothetical protein Cob_v010570 [Colletotrichum orbiculare MAFF 240422]|uniref:Uncharacterized protein n=1 Tax=Colletotrichum orbiculare (strain 104-T / ATCC 96160 / CBS 514.97 / LARS 414 / MAFF 240422) TaxID=1213857 RepID=A0A484FFJ1_COLOR|nr:hypothetical protein Cob_v010570 [Colletotrichum orbiculare MAFF 240422]
MIHTGERLSSVTNSAALIRDRIRPLGHTTFRVSSMDLPSVSAPLFVGVDFQPPKQKVTIASIRGVKPPRFWRLASRR